MPVLSRRGVLALAREQLSFELDEHKFMVLATAAASDTAVAGGSGNEARPDGRITVRSTAELAALFVDLLLGEEKFFPSALAP